MVIIGIIILILLIVLTIDFTIFSNNVDTANKNICGWLKDISEKLDKVIKTKNNE